MCPGSAGASSSWRRLARDGNGGPLRFLFGLSAVRPRALLHVLVVVLVPLTSIATVPRYCCGGRSRDSFWMRVKITMKSEGGNGANSNEVWWSGGQAGDVCTAVP
mmetsp:Transcript_5157/g.15578  ORF Transcript_5157/g.15578 Transcript_5157/m.15578 type:complete len:105 (-) Transcript_5157:98-412(-)